MYKQVIRLCNSILTYHKKKSTNIPDLFENSCAALLWSSGAAGQIHPQIEKKSLLR